MLGLRGVPNNLARAAHAGPHLRATQTKVRLTWHAGPVAARCRPFWAIGYPARGRSVDGRSDGPSHAIGVVALSAGSGLERTYSACDSTRQGRSAQEAAWGTRFECHQRPRSG
jgi:hypothetical protein